MADAARIDLLIPSCVCNKSRYIAVFNRFAGMCVGRCKGREFCMDLWCFSAFWEDYIYWCGHVMDLVS